MPHLTSNHWPLTAGVDGLPPGQRIARVDTPFQCIEIWDTPTLGRLYTLDGRPMAATGDEYIYHECMTHPAALTLAAPRRALVLGGGDGGAARELLKHPSITEIVIAELDAQVVAMARRYFALLHQGAFDDPRVALRIGDAADFVSRHAGSGAAPFDLAIFDLTPPDSPAHGLFSAAFFERLKTVLTPQALISVHLGAPSTEPARVHRVWQDLRSAFRQVRIMTAEIPTYGGLWAMALAGDDEIAADTKRRSPRIAVDPATLSTEFVAATLAARHIEGLRYYNAARHPALFVPPACLRHLIAV